MEFPVSYTHEILSATRLTSFAARPVTCDTVGDVCATNTYLGAFGCCPGTDLFDCTLATACVPLASVGDCNAACLADPYVTICDSGAPYCQYDLFVFPNSALTYFGCAAQEIIVTVYPTYSGGDTTAQFTPFSVSKTNSVSIPNVTPITAAVSSQPPSGAKSSSSTSQPATSTPASTSKSVPAGAIAGGVVGGLAVVAAFGFGIFYLLSRRRRRDSPGPNVTVGGPPTVDPKSPMTTYAAPAGDGIAGAAVGAAAAGPIGGGQAEYYAQPNTAGPLPEKTMAASTMPQMPYQSPQPQYQHMSYIPEGTPAVGLPPQGQQVPAVSPPMSPAPPYVDANRMSMAPSHDGSVQPPMNDASMIDGRQVWPTGAGVVEAPGSIPGQPSGHY